MASKRLLAALLYVLMSPAPLHAAMTLSARETFQGVGTLEGDAPGNLGTVNDGIFVKRPVGPRLTNDTTAQARGWSADAILQYRFDHTMVGKGLFPLDNSSPTGVSTVFAYDWWVYLDQPAGGGNAGQTLLDVSSPFSGQTLLSVQTAPSDGLTLAYFGNAVAAANNLAPFTIPLRRWTNLRVVVLQRSPGYYDFDVALFVRAPGSAWEELLNANDVRIYGNLQGVLAGFRNTGAQPSVRGRYGMPSLYRLDSWADRTLSVLDVVDPPAGPFSWYVNPISGSDGNDGCSPETAWVSAAKVNTESQALGMFGTDGGYTHGDSLTIDTSLGNLLLGATSLYLRTQGLNAQMIGAGEVQAWEDLSGAAWTQTQGTSSVYQCTLSGLTAGNTDVVVWQNDCWMHHPVGTVLSDVQASLIATEGSFWTDGLTLYVHPFGGSNPAVDNQVYTRSYLRGNSGDAAVELCAMDLHLMNFRVRKTCVARKTDNDPYSCYCYQTAESAGGNILLENCFGDYGSKHIFGFTDASISRHYTARLCQAEQASPYADYGGQSCWVDFGDGSGTGTATSVYDRCITNHNAGLIGSTVGKIDIDQPIWISHGSGPVYSSISFQNCKMDGGPLVAYGGISSMLVQGGTMPAGTFSGGDVIYDRVRISGPPPTARDTGTTVLVRNCLIAPMTLAGIPQELMGNVTVQGCTIDCRGIAPGPFYQRTGMLNLTWRDNLLLGTGCPVVVNAFSTDSLMFDHNAYSPGVGTIVGAYNDGSTSADRSLAQWQALGRDDGSLAIADPVIDANDFPTANSPLLNVGAILGGITDFTGRFFNIRQTIGALEPLDTFARWQVQNFTAAETTTAAITGPGADPDGDGVSNLLEYALATPPKQANSVAVTSGVQVIAGQFYLTLSFTQREYSADLSYLPQASTDLIQWNGGTSAIVTVSATDNGDGTESTVIRAAQPLGATPRCFLRLQVSVPNTDVSSGAVK